MDPDMSKNKTKLTATLLTRVHMTHCKLNKNVKKKKKKDSHTLNQTIQIAVSV